GAMPGRMVVIGSRGTIAINPGGGMTMNAALIGVAIVHASPAQLAGIHAALVEGLGNGTLRPAIAQEIPLAQGPRAHEAVMAAGHRCQIVLVPCPATSASAFLPRTRWSRSSAYSCRRPTMPTSG